MKEPGLPVEKGSFDSSNGPEQVAWKLIVRALERTITTILDEYRAVIKKDIDEQELLDLLNDRFREEEIEINSEFFANPAGFPLLEKIDGYIICFLTKYGLTDAEARTVVERLPSYFLYALHTVWIEEPQSYEMILKSVDFTGANLSRVNLRRAKLRGVDFSGANLDYAELLGVDLEGASLVGATLNFAKLGGADLNNADLSKADLTGADLDRANLYNAKLDDTVFLEARFSDTFIDLPNYKRLKELEVDVTGLVPVNEYLERIELE